MGAIYEVMSTPGVYAMPAWYDAHRPARDHGPIAIPFGSDRLQHCVLWEPSEVRHDAVVMWFHGGGYLVGTPESMENAADVYNSQGYRFVSVGFRLMPRHPFPTQVDDAFAGVSAAISWLRANGRPCESVEVGGSSAGGMSAALVAYGMMLQKRHGLDAAPIKACVSCAAVLDADDMLLDPMPKGNAWYHFVNLRGAGGTREDRHDALLPYSPIHLAGRHSSVPFFGVHGTSDTMSPYAHEQAFVDRLNRLAGDGMATLHTVDDPAWQHMVTTVTMHKRQVETDPVLSHLFSWLARTAD